VPQYVSVVNEQLFIPKFTDGIKMICDRKIQGLIKKCIISKTPSDKYFVSILVEKEYTEKTKTNKSVGIDLGLKDFLITSDGLKAKNHRYFKKYQRKLKLNQQHLSRKIKGSNRYNKQKLKVARIHEKISNCRADLIHKTTSNLIKNYDVIYLENLNIKGLLKNHKLSKSISDVAWYKFIEVLKYKADWNNKKVIQISRWFPSTKTCNSCGFINQNLKLKDRTWICPKCGVNHDRDLNAAKNILDEGLRINITDSSV
jgi:putative transposase